MVKTAGYFDCADTRSVLKRDMHGWGASHIMRVCCARRDGCFGPGRPELYGKTVAVRVGKAPVYRPY
jgi:hypothetical protein